MRVRALTQKGTIPVYMKLGRKKPFRLRVTIGGKQHEQYFATRAEAEAEWEKLAPLASVREQPLHAPEVPTGLTLRDVAEYLHWKARLAYAGLTIAEAARLALEAKAGTSPEAPPTEEAMPSWIDPEDVAPLLHEMASDIRILADQLRGPNPREVQTRVLRTMKSAAIYCGFANVEAFIRWASRVGFEIPKTKLVKQQRAAFLVSELDAALLRDPSIHPNRRLRPAPSVL